MRWAIDAVPAGQLISQMPDCVPLVLMHTLRTHGKVVEGTEEAGTWSLDPPKIAAFRCRQLLEGRQESDGLWELEEFKTKWEMRLPSGCSVNLDDMKGKGRAHADFGD